MKVLKLNPKQHKIKEDKDTPPCPAATAEKN